MKVKFNLYEKLFLVIGISFVTLVAVNSQASLLATIFSILCILNAVYAAKGLILGYVFEIFSTFIYIYLSLNQRFSYFNNKSNSSLPIIPMDVDII